MKKLKISLLLLISLALMGCGASMMVKAPSQDLKAPSSGMATIVFMRTSFVAGAIGVELFETTNGKLKLIGELSTGTKIAYQTTPGNKVFMTYGTAADFMKANVLAGKTYYVIARPNWGTGGFAPTPVRNDSTSEYNVKSSDFNGWVTDTELVVPGPEVAGWLKNEENRKKMDEVYTEYWKRFQTKDSNEVAERTLNPQDGI